MEPLWYYQGKFTHLVEQHDVYADMFQTVAYFCPSKSWLQQELENKRKERAQVAYERRKQLAKLRVKAEKAAEEKLGPQLAVIAPIKYWIGSWDIVITKYNFVKDR